MSKLKFSLLSLISLVYLVCLFFIVMDIHNSFTELKWAVIDYLLRQPVSVSYAHYLPDSAADVNEKFVDIQDYPVGDREFEYYLKAKVTKEEFLKFAEDLELEWASPVHRSSIPSRNSQIPWWEPPSNTFLYAYGKDDFCMQADYVHSTGYMYFYISQY